MSDSPQPTILDVLTDLLAVMKDLRDDIRVLRNLAEDGEET